MPQPPDIAGVASNSSRVRECIDSGLYGVFQMPALAFSIIFRSGYYKYHAFLNFFTSSVAVGWMAVLRYIISTFKKYLEYTTRCLPAFSTP